MTQKVIGYLLLIIGIVAIVYPAFSVYRVFTKEATPAPLFSFSGISMDPSKLLAGVKLPEGAAIPEGATMEIVTPEMMNSVSNLFAHVILMGFIAGTGFKLGSLGVQMVRELKVNVKTTGDPIV